MHSSGSRSFHRRIATATVVVGLFVLVSRLGMLLREVAISWKYGASGTVDAYQIAFSVTTWLPMALVSVFSVVLVPTLVRMQQETAETRSQFLSELNAAALVAGVCIALAAAAGLPHAALAMAASLPAATQEAAAAMTRQIAPVAGMMIAAGVLSARLMARERHANTLLEGLPGLAICLAVILWHASAPGADLVTGLLLGTTVQVLWLAALVARDPDGIGSPTLTLKSEAWPAVYQAMWVMSVGQVFMALITPLEQVFAARLGEGAVAVLGYANRIFTLIANLGAMAISRALLPVLANVRAATDAAQARAIAFRWAWAMGAAGFGVVLVGWPLAPQVVILLFERGAFARADSLAVAEAVQWGLLQFPFYFAGIVLVQLLVVAGRYRILTLIAVPNLTVKLIFTALLAEALGVRGITLATAFMYLFSCLCLVFAAQSRHR